MGVYRGEKEEKQHQENVWHTLYLSFEHIHTHTHKTFSNTFTHTLFQIHTHTLFQIHTQTHTHPFLHPQPLSSHTAHNTHSRKFYDNNGCALGVKTCLSLRVSECVRMRESERERGFMFVFGVCVFLGQGSSRQKICLNMRVLAPCIHNSPSAINDWELPLRLGCARTHERAFFLTQKKPTARPNSISTTTTWKSSGNSLTILCGTKPVPSPMHCMHEYALSLTLSLFLSLSLSRA